MFLSVFVGVVWVQRHIGKRPLLVWSTLCLIILNFAVAITMYYSNVVGTEFFMCLFMIPYGGAFNSPIWAYPSEIVPASQMLGPSLTHWAALALSTLIPPLVMGAMPNNNPYPIFFFYGTVTIFGFIHMYRSLRESDGYTYDQIIKSFY
jgi:hypothetical protein